MKDINDEECTYYNAPIRPCGSENCETCTDLITSNTFKSSLTGKTYHTKTFEPLSWKFLNVIYSFNCKKCEQLLYVGETGCPLHQRMNGHRSGASDDDKLVYLHFQFPGSSPSDMKLQILEKVLKKFGSTTLTKPERERVELKWIKEWGTAAPYGLIDKINGGGILTSPSTSEVNRIGICNKQVRRRRSRGLRKTTSPSRRQLPTIDELVKLLVTANGPHQVRTQLYSLPLTSLHQLCELVTDLRFIGDYVSPKARIISIIFDISRFRLIKLVRNDVNCNGIRSFLKLKFVNMGMDDFNLSNILHDM